MESQSGQSPSSIDVLKSNLGADRFLRFVAALNRDSGPGLRAWQDRALDKVDRSYKPSLPRSRRELLDLLAAHLPAPPTLDPTEIPAWLRIDSLGGLAPVQGEGAVVPGGYWYFRARHNHWTLEVWTGGPHDGHPESPDYTLYDEEYGLVRFAAGYMPFGTALHYIVYALNRWRNREPPPSTQPEC